MTVCHSIGFHRYELVLHSKITLRGRRDDVFYLGFKLFKDQIILVTERFEPSSRIFLNGEQPYPWDLLQPQDKMSRHRGAELRRRYELLGGTSLLSPE